MRAAAMGEGVDARGGRVLTAGERYHVLSPHVLLQALERRHLARLGEVGEVVRQVDRVVYFLYVHRVRRLRRWRVMVMGMKQGGARRVRPCAIDKSMTMRQ